MSSSVPYFCALFWIFLLNLSFRCMFSLRQREGKIPLHMSFMACWFLRHLSLESSVPSFCALFWIFLLNFSFFHCMFTLSDHEHEGKGKILLHMSFMACLWSLMEHFPSPRTNWSNHFDFHAYCYSTSW